MGFTSLIVVLISIESNNANMIVQSKYKIVNEDLNLLKQYIIDTFKVYDFLLKNRSNDCLDANDYIIYKFSKLLLSPKFNILPYPIRLYFDKYALIINSPLDIVENKHYKLIEVSKSYLGDYETFCKKLPLHMACKKLYLNDISEIDSFFDSDAVCNSYDKLAINSDGEEIYNLLYVFISDLYYIPIKKIILDDEKKRDEIYWNKKIDKFLKKAR